MKTVRFIIVLCSTVLFAQDSVAVNSKNTQLSDSMINSDCFYAGQKAAQNDINDTKYRDFGSGLLLSVFGVGIGYIKHSFNDIEVPNSYTAELSDKEKFEFENGYKETYRQIRKSSFLNALMAGAYCQVLILGGVLVYAVYVELRDHGIN